MCPNSNLEYREIQKLRTWWHWILGFSIPVLFFSIGFIQWIFHVSVGNHPLSTVWCFALGSFFLCSISVLFYYLTLQLNITNAGITYGFNIPGPELHFISWDRISSAKLISYQFWSYGYHVSMRYGLVYNLNGRYGIQIKLNNGEKILIGTQHKNELKSFLNSIYQDESA